MSGMEGAYRRFDPAKSARRFNGEKLKSLDWKKPLGTSHFFAKMKKEPLPGEPLPGEALPGEALPGEALLEAAIPGLTSAVAASMVSGTSNSTPSQVDSGNLVSVASSGDFRPGAPVLEEALPVEALPVEALLEEGGIPEGVAVPAAPGAGSLKFSQDWHIVKSNKSDGSDAIRSVLGAGYGEIFDPTLVKTRMIDSTTIRSLFVEGLEVSRDFFNYLDGLTEKKLEELNISGVFAARFVRKDVDNHEGNFGRVACGYFFLIVSFDTDQSGFGRLCPIYGVSLNMIEKPGGYTEPLFYWEDTSLDMTSSYVNGPLSALARIGGVNYTLPFNLYRKEINPSSREVHEKRVVSLSRREYEKEPDKFICKPREHDFLRKLAESEIARRQQFMCFVFNTCIPEDQFYKIKEARIHPDADQDYANHFTFDHIEHLKKIRQGLLSSIVFRMDFLAHFDEYQEKMLKFLGDYNAQYKDSDLGLKIDLRVALENLNKLKLSAENPPIFSDLSHPAITLIQYLAYLGSIPQDEDDLSNDKKIQENLNLLFTHVCEKLKDDFMKGPRGPAEVQACSIVIRDLKTNLQKVLEAGVIYEIRSRTYKDALDGLFKTVKDNADFAETSRIRAAMAALYSLNEELFRKGKYVSRNEYLKLFKVFGIGLNLSMKSAMNQRFSYPADESLTRLIMSPFFQIAGSWQTTLTNILSGPVFDRRKIQVYSGAYLEFFLASKVFSEAFSIGDFRRFCDISESCLVQIRERGLNSPELQAALTWVGEQKRLWSAPPPLTTTATPCRDLAAAAASGKADLGVPPDSP